jgi:hypothetical protein
MLEWNDSQEHSFCIHIMLVSQTNHNPISPFFAYATPPTKRKSGTQRENRLSISSPVHTFANSNRQTRQQADDDLLLLLLLTNKQTKGLCCCCCCWTEYPSFLRYLLRGSSRASLVLRAVSDRMNLESPWRGFMASSSHRVNLKCLLLEQSVIIDRTWDEHVEQSRLRWTWSRL